MQFHELNARGFFYFKMYIGPQTEGPKHTLAVWAVLLSHNWITLEKV